ncbi:MAG TPA: hypothetical protein VI383_03705, partial [Gemmatimonadales bacterium]|nr:hypothetical protein [Gemmatimonadales bacterium]
MRLSSARSGALFNAAFVATLLPLPLARILAQGAQAPSAQVVAELEASRARLAAETYVRPPDEIARLVTAPRQGNVTLSQPSPDGRYLLRQESDGLPSLRVLGKAHFYFAGLQVD